MIEAMGIDLQKKVQGTSPLPSFSFPSLELGPLKSI